MKEINLRELYPDIYSADIFVEVTDEVWAAIQTSQRVEATYERQKFRYKAYYSLDHGDGIEGCLLVQPLAPENIIENKWLYIELQNAIRKLPPAQRRRIYARFYLGRTIAEIARKERVDQRRVGKSIQCGLERLAWLLEIDS
ncbi:RNA polymerase subunit sigma-70 [Faecalibacterium sp. An58]|uniref:sigma factor-like helix-turn-helix DNA-binding protein n=1 Tax=unclassified Faecalibacterium TaxID=2646395 RepID=UPI000B368550|nr:MULTISPECIES: sigma factor-like helix-turn-helix DNA-binding protein [unclassified Faecalibacterium]OUN68850.1 RNA polymerase subunit sigma-70 [Faecalibacterium sp. An58]OUP28841.1 RNA polymerase subunit sigma-70 [Faecalibacterium sp. An192]